MTICRQSLQFRSKQLCSCHKNLLLLGTGGTGKTTTLQAANRLLETQGLAGRIVRCAYTGVAASNRGMGGRTLVSLFRLSRRGFGGGLEPLSSENILRMDQELKGLCLLEICLNA